MEALKDVINVIAKNIPPLHKEGHLFVLFFAIVSLVLGLAWEPLGWLGALATLWCAYFFRDPARVTPDGDNFVISPADGLVQKIEKASPPEELGLEDKEFTRISIFLNVFDVHVNRNPLSGEVVQLNYRPGKFLSANLDKASSDNERQSVVVRTENGQEIIYVQIAGLVARRIVCDLTEGERVVAGGRFGLIRFGSRVDIYLPDGAVPMVIEGQRAIAGESVIADLNSKLAVRTGEVR